MALPSSRKVTKVVIPVAGMGTRFLPATKALPKELLPVVSKPIIHHIIEEAVKAGLETVVLVTSRPKVVIEDYFDPGDLTSYRLAESHKEKLIEEVLYLSSKIDIVSIRQYKPMGLGHAILRAKPIVEGQPFAVILGDDIMKCSGPSAIHQCLNVFQERGEGSVVGAVQVEREATRLYGVIDPAPSIEDIKKGSWRLKDFVEKPDPAEAPSEWALPGRYVFEPEILEELQNAGPGKNGEIQLTDSMQKLQARKPFWACALEGERFDTGDRLGYIMANVAYALEEESTHHALRTWLSRQLAR